MTEGNFVDYVKIYVSSGKGGKGSTHLHREKFIEKGGPDGGDGGRGGHVYLVGNKGLWTLFHLKFARHIKAGNGGDGSGDRSTGADGDDKFIEVPLGMVKKKKKAIKDYINWYNSDRVCKKLKGLSPINFRKQALNSVSMT